MPAWLQIADVIGLIEDAPIANTFRRSSYFQMGAGIGMALVVREGDPSGDADPDTVVLLYSK